MYHRALIVAAGALQLAFIRLSINTKRKCNLSNPI